jgi:hypothetical protein
MAWVVNTAAATSAADKNVTLVMWFLHMVKEAEEVRLLRFKCGEPCVVKSKHFFTHVQACAIG